MTELIAGQHLCVQGRKPLVLSEKEQERSDRIPLAESTHKAVFSKDVFCVSLPCTNSCQTSLLSKCSLCVAVDEVRLLPASRDAPGAVGDHCTACALPSLNRAPWCSIEHGGRHGALGPLTGSI